MKKFNIVEFSKLESAYISDNNTIEQKRYLLTNMIAMLDELKENKAG